MVIIMITLSSIGAIAPKSSTGWTRALDCCPRPVFLSRKLSSRLTTNFRASACKKWPDVSPCFRPDGLSCDACRSRGRSEEHTSELQSHVNLVCRLLLEKKKNKKTIETE